MYAPEFFGWWHAGGRVGVHELLGAVLGGLHVLGAHLEDVLERGGGACELALEQRDDVATVLFCAVGGLAGAVGLVECLQIRELLVDRCNVVLDDVRQLRDLHGSIVEERLASRHCQSNKRAKGQGQCRFKGHGGWVSRENAHCARRCSLAVVEAMSLPIAWALRANSPFDEDACALLSSFCFAGGWEDLDAMDSTRPWNSDVRSLTEWRSSTRWVCTTWLPRREWMLFSCELCCSADGEEAARSLRVDVTVTVALSVTWSERDGRGVGESVSVRERVRVRSGRARPHASPEAEHFCEFPVFLAQIQNSTAHRSLEAVEIGGPLARWRKPTLSALILPFLPFLHLLYSFPSAQTRRRRRRRRRS